MNSEQRKAELERIQANSEPCMTGIILTYYGERKNFNAYKIPLSILTYNPYNGRIGSEVKSFERQNHVLEPDNPDDIALIEKFLWDSKEDANERTKQSLLDDHQQRYGIVTADGKIIDGNRRASLLNRIWKDDSIPANKKQHTRFFIAIILPTDADRKEILRLETTYQMGEDAKVDYGPIEKYLKAGDLAEEGFSNNEIASFMGVTPREVRDYLNVLKLMNDYLDTYGYTGIYTMLDGNEDSFLKLESALRGYAAGGVTKMWGYDVEADVSDLKSIAFDYIRLGLDQQDFRDIIRKPNRHNTDASFFSNEEIWRNFSDNHFSAVEDVTEETVENIIRNNPTGDLKRLLRARDNAWRNAIGEKLNENFNRSRDKLNNKQQAAEPIKLLQKAWEAISAVDINQDSFKQDPGVKEYLAEIEELAKQYGAILRE
jgi:hypothetical protein